MSVTIGGSARECVVVSSRDISGATWGGSSSEEEEEEEVSSMTGLDDTRDDQLEHTFSGTLGTP